MSDKLREALNLAVNTAFGMVYRCGHPRGGCKSHCDLLVKVIDAGRAALAEKPAERPCHTVNVVKGLKCATCGAEVPYVTKYPADEMVSWLNDLNSNWAVLRNTRSFLEGQPSEYWKKFDSCMGEAFELQVALMKLTGVAEKVPPDSCPDCDAAKRHAYSDATTPGFFYTKCEKHRKEGR